MSVNFSAPFHHKHHWQVTFRAFLSTFLTAGEHLETIFSQRKDLDGMKGEKNRQPVNFPFFWLRGVK